MYGIISERPLMREIQVNLASRWFLVYDLDEVRKEELVQLPLSVSDYVRRLYQDNDAAPEDEVPSDPEASLAEADSIDVHGGVSLAVGERFRKPQSTPPT